MSIDFNNLRLADEDYFIPSSVELLLRADVYPYVLNSSNPSLMLGKPAIFDTMFACVLVGPVNSISSINLITSLLAISPLLDSVLKQFWGVEEVSHIPEVNEDAFVEDDFQKNLYSK